jgi:hypothetical protein
MEKRGRKPKLKIEYIPPAEAAHPLWLSISEAAKLSGVGQKTIRRSIEHKAVLFTINKNRYLINFSSLINYLCKTTKLKNKFINNGLGQYVEKWKN